MKTLILGLTAAAATFAAGAAMAAPYGYNGYSTYSYSQPRYVAPSYGYAYGNRFVAARDSDRDGIPDRAEWNQDRDRDGRLDQYDAYDNRRDHYRSGQRRWSDDARRYDDRRYVPYERYDSYGRSYR